MARAGILYSHLARAAASLAAAGTNPTIDTVRAALGGTGSKSTIAPMLKQWKAEHQGETVAAGAGLPADLLQAVKAVYDGLRASAMVQLEASATAHQAEMQEARTEAQQLRAQCAALTSEKATVAADLTSATSVIARLQVDMQSKDVTLAGAQSDNAGLVQRLADRAAEVMTIKQQLTHARTQFEHYQESNALQRSEERQSFERRVAQQDQELAHLRQHLELKQVAAAQHAGQLSRVVEENERLQSETRAAHQELANVRAERDHLASQSAELTSAHTLMQAKQDNLELERGELRTLLAVLGREMELASEQLGGTESRAVMLEQEKLTLLQRQAALEAELSLCRAATDRPLR